MTQPPTPEAQGSDLIADWRSIALRERFILAVMAACAFTAECEHVAEANSLRDRALDRTVRAQAAEAENERLRGALDGFTIYQVEGQEDRLYLRADGFTTDVSVGGAVGMALLRLAALQQAALSQSTGDTK